MSLNETSQIPIFSHITRYAHSKSNACKTPKKQNLLRYPAIPLEETMTKFLRSVQPLLSDKEYEQTQQMAEEFQCVEGAELQKLLEKLAESEENWLAPRWLKTAYLGYRDPVTIYSSPGMSFPLTQFKNLDEYFMYTAKLIMGLVKFKKQVDEGLIPVTKMGNLELDNSQFGVVYGTCRIPLVKEDSIVYNPLSQHVVVIHRNHVNIETFYYSHNSLNTSTLLVLQATGLYQKWSDIKC